MLQDACVVLSSIVLCTMTQNSLNIYGALVWGGEWGGVILVESAPKIPRKN